MPWPEHIRGHRKFGVGDTDEVTEGEAPLVSDAEGDSVLDGESDRVEDGEMEGLLEGGTDALADVCEQSSPDQNSSHEHTPVD